MLLLLGLMRPCSEYLARFHLESTCSIDTARLAGDVPIGSYQSTSRGLHAGPSKRDQKPTQGEPTPTNRD